MVDLQYQTQPHGMDNAMSGKIVKGPWGSSEHHCSSVLLIIGCPWGQTSTQHTPMSYFKDMEIKQENKKDTYGPEYFKDRSSL